MSGARTALHSPVCLCVACHRILLRIGFHQPTMLC